MENFRISLFLRGIFLSWKKNRNIEGIFFFHLQIYLILFKVYFLFTFFWGWGIFFSFIVFSIFLAVFVFIRMNFTIFLVGFLLRFWIFFGTFLSQFLWIFCAFFRSLFRMDKVHSLHYKFSFANFYIKELFFGKFWKISLRKSKRDFWGFSSQKLLWHYLLQKWRI